jgi:hypothetical protein
MTNQMGVRWAGHVVYVGEMRNFYTVGFGKTGGKRPCGRPRRRLEEDM